MREEKVIFTCDQCDCVLEERNIHIYGLIIEYDGEVYRVDEEDNRSYVINSLNFCSVQCLARYLNEQIKNMKENK